MTKIRQFVYNILDRLENNRKLSIVFIALCTALVIIIPQTGLLSSYILRIITNVCLYTILALSLNLLTGYTGLVSIGHAGFCAVGGYTSALLAQQFGLPWYITAICGMILAALVGLVIALPLGRLEGTYLTIATLGFGETVKMVALNWQTVTRGPLGVKNIPRPEFFGIQLTNKNGGYLYLAVILLVLVTIFMRRLIKSKWGRAFMSIRDDSLAATLMGVEVSRYKILAFVIAAAIAGLGGAFSTHFITFIDPNTYNFDISIIIISCVILGGMGTIPGMFVGAILLISFPEVLRFASEYRFIIYGLILVLMMRFKPEGLLGGHSKRRYKMPKDVRSDYQ
jgi:branched-chain amino acid transport system permease protein